MAKKHYYKKVWLLLAIFGFTCAQANAQEARDTLEVHFRVGNSNLDLNFADNKREIDQFVQYINANYANVPAQYLKLDVYSGASPEGPIEINRRLGEERGLALKQALLDRLGWLNGRIAVINQGARWGGLYKMIEDSNEPWKYDVLKIIQEDPSEDTWARDNREAKLRKLDRRRRQWYLSDEIKMWKAQEREARARFEAEAQAAAAEEFAGEEGGKEEGPKE